MNTCLDIIDLLNKYVQELAKIKYATDTTCPPQFWVSILGYGENQKIVLSVSHLGSSYSKILFPQPDADYGYETIEQEVEWLYNRTM